MDDLPQLTVNDLVALQQTIDLACNRGAFKAEEMTQIGTVYDKLSRFLEALISQLNPQSAETDLSADTPQGE